jgi:hypothetical protein
VALLCHPLSSNLRQLLLVDISNCRRLYREGRRQRRRKGSWQSGRQRLFGQPREADSGADFGGGGFEADGAADGLYGAADELEAPAG